MMIKRQSGFSLLELALGLFVLGFLFALLPMMISSLGNLQSANPTADPLDNGQQALTGFIIQHDRLPCPDQNNDGFENCNGARSGGFPYHTVKLGRPLLNAHGFALHYGVYQHPATNLSALQNRYQPSLLGTIPVEQLNGLDFCQGLRLGLSAGLQTTEISVQAFTGGAGVNPAFVLIDPGRLDADVDGRLFDGLNATGLVFESSANEQSERYDDNVRAMSFAELSAQLRCPEILARASAATRDANAAYDMLQSYLFYETFRTFGVAVRTGALDMAETKKNLAIANGGISAAMIFSDTASLLSDPGGAAAVAVYAANTIITLALVAEELIGAEEEVNEKKEELVTANQQLSNAQAAKNSASNYSDKARIEALNRDARGWFQ